MLDQDMLAEHFQTLLAGERAALEAYRRLVPEVKDAKLLQQLEVLVRDKQRHVQLAQRLLEIVE